MSINVAKNSLLTQFVVVLSSPASQIFLEREDAGNVIVLAAWLEHMRFCNTENSALFVKASYHSKGKNSQWTDWK